jgi:hypothetical protein
MVSVAHPKLTPDEVTWAVTRYRAGDRLVDIARDLRVTTPAILYHVRRARQCDDRLEAKR